MDPLTIAVCGVAGLYVAKETGLLGLVNVKKFRKRFKKAMNTVEKEANKNEPTMTGKGPAISK